MSVLEIFSTQPIIPRIGWALIHSLWQGAAIAGLLALVLLVLRRASANVRYLCACAALALMIAGPAATYWRLAPPEPAPLPALAEIPESELPEVPLSTIPPAVYGSFDAPEPTTNTPAASLPPPPPPPPRPWHERAKDFVEANLPWVVGAWLIGVLFLSIRLFAGWIGVRRMKKSGTPVPQTLLEQMKCLAKKLRVSRPVQLLQSTVAGAPLVIGWFRPVILFPASVLTQLSAEQLEAVLAHELAHVRRHDYIVNLLQTIVETLFFYHPGVYWISKRIRIEREHCCDDLAVSAGTNPNSYARALARLAEMTASAPRLAPAASGHLFARIRRLLARDTARHSHTTVWFCGTIMITLLLVTVITFGAVKAAEEKEKTNTYPDYSALFELTDMGEEFRAPTAEEIKKLDEFGLWPTVPPEENAAYWFAKANKNLRESNKSLPPPHGSASSNIPFDGDATGFLNYVHQNQDVIATTREGLSRAKFHTILSIEKKTGTPVPLLHQLADIRNLSRFLSDAGFAAELQRDNAAAAQHYIDYMRVGASMREDSTLTADLVGIVIQAVGRNNLASLMANAALDQESLEHIIGVAQQAETTTQDYLNALHADAAFAHATMAMSPIQAQILGKDYDEFITFAEKEFAKPLPELLRSGENNAKRIGEQWPLLKETVYPSLMVNLPIEWGHADLRARELQVRAAIALYEKQYNEPPDELTALVPDFLPAIPEDPFSGKPLRYARDGKNWKLWSVGRDFKDDGGTVNEERYDAGKGRIWDGPDYVFLSDIPSNIERRSKGTIKELPELKGDQASPPDYSALFELTDMGDEFRAPTAEEIEKLNEVGLWPIVPLEENAAYWFAAFNAQLNQLPLESIPPGSLFDQHRPYAGDTVEFGKWVESLQDALNFLPSADRTEVTQYPPFIRKDSGLVRIGLDDLGWQVWKACADAGFLDELHGNAEAAAHRYLSAVSTGAVVARNGDEGAVLTGSRASRRGAAALDRLIAHSQLSDGTLRQVVASCQPAMVTPDELRATLAKGISVELAHLELADTPEKWKKYQESWKQLYGGEITDRKIHHEKLMMLQTELARQFQGAWPDMLTRTSQIDKALKTALKDYRPLQNVCTADIPYMCDVAQSNVQLIETQVRAAIAIYQQQHNGALPVKLEALVPEILPAVPIDPFSGKAICYKLSDKGWSLWSVGADNKDDNGTVADMESPWNGPDYFFASDVPTNLAERSKGQPFVMPDRSTADMNHESAYAHGEIALEYEGHGDPAVVAEFLNQLRKAEERTVHFSALCTIQRSDGTLWIEGRWMRDGAKLRTDRTPSHPGEDVALETYDGEFQRTAWRGGNWGRISRPQFPDALNRFPAILLGLNLGLVRTWGPLSARLGEWHDWTVQLDKTRQVYVLDGHYRGRDLADYPLTRLQVEFDARDGVLLKSEEWSTPNDRHAPYIRSALTVDEFVQKDGVRVPVEATLTTTNIKESSTGRIFLDKDSISLAPIPPEMFVITFPLGAAVQDLTKSGGTASTGLTLGLSHPAHPTNKNEAGAFIDYSTLFELAGMGEELRAPTPEEIEKLDEFGLWPTVPPEENAAYYYVKAYKNVYDYLVQFGDPPGSMLTERPFEGDTVGFLNYTLRDRSILEAIQKGLSQSTFQVVPVIVKDNGSVVSYNELLARVRNTGRFLSDVGFAAELQRDPDTAAERYLDCIRMGGPMRGQGNMITSLVGIAIQSLGASDLEGLVANSPLDDESLKRIVTTARQAEITTEDRLAILREEAKFAHAMKAISPGQAQMFGEDYDEFMAFAQKEFDKPLPELLQSGEERTKKAAERWPAFKQEVLTLLVTLPEKWAILNLGFRELQIRAAIALYEKKHNEPPSELTALVPDFLPAVPEDPFSGKPLRYARDGKNWRLWSVGEDFKDDGGITGKSRIGPDRVYKNDIHSNIWIRSNGTIKDVPELKAETTTVEERDQEQPWGEAVEGVQVRLRADKNVWQAGERPTFKADVRNQGTQTLRIYNKPNIKDDWQFECDGVWHHPLIVSSAKGPEFSFAPNQRLSGIPIGFDDWLQDESTLGETSKPRYIHLEAPPKLGKHTIRIAFTSWSPEQRRQVRAVSNPVEITVVESALPGSRISIEEALADPDFAFAVVCQATTDAMTYGVSTQDFDIIEVLLAEHATDAKIKFQYTTLKAERILAKGERAIWIVRSQRTGGETVGWKGIKALPDTPENRVAVTAAFAKTATRRKIEEALNTKIEAFSFEEVPLDEIINFFKLLPAFENANFILDNDVLANREIFVTLTMANTTLKTSLEAILKPRSLDFTIWNDAILISTSERIRKLTDQANNNDAPPTATAPPDGTSRPALATRTPVTSTSRPAPTPKPNAESVLDIKKNAFTFEKTPLRDVFDIFKMLSQFKDINFVLDEDALGEDEIPITRTMNGVSLRETLTEILKPNGLDFAVRNDTIYVSTPERLKGLVKNAQTLKTEAALDERIEAFSFEEMPLSEVINFFKLLPQFDGINFIIDYAATNDQEVFVTSTMQDVTLRTALTAMLKPKGLSFTIWNDAIFISTPGRIKELQ